MLDYVAIDGNLGVTFLRDRDVTLDLATGRAWAAAARRPATILRTALTTT